LPTTLAGYLALVVVAAVFGCLKAHRPTAGPGSPVADVQSISLPGAPATGVAMDYLAYDASHHRVGARRQHGKRGRRRHRRR